MSALFVAPQLLCAERKLGGGSTVALSLGAALARRALAVVALLHAHVQTALEHLLTHLPARRCNVCALELCILVFAARNKTL